MKTTGLALLACVVFASTTVAAPHFRGAEHEPGPRFLQMMGDRLGLSAEQEEHITAVVNASRLENAEDRERISQLRQELAALSLGADMFDQDRARLLAEELAQIVARMAVAGAELRWQVRQELTEEQRQRIDTWRGAHPMRPPSHGMLDSP